MKSSAQSVLVLVTIVLGFNACATTFYVDAANPSPAAFTNWPTAAADIQSAIDAATDGDLILVTNGLYNTGGRVVNSYGTGGGVSYGSPITNRVVVNKAVTVRSVNGPAVAVIQGYHFNYIQTNSSGVTNYNSDVRGVYMTNNAMLDGFTVTGGGGSGSGSGVYCESTNCFLTNCVLTGNVSAGNGSLYGGAGVYQGTLNNCILSNNLVPISPWNYAVNGGGAYKSILNNCQVVSNSSSFGGGAAYSTLNNCIVIGNSASNYGSTSWGGGTYMCTANNCLIAGNLSTTAGGGDCFGILNCCILSNNICANPPFNNAAGGGSYLGNGGANGGALNNCLVISNVVNGRGGGVYFNSSAPFANCTVVGNAATYQGGGVYYGNSTNCIIYGNYCSPSSFSYSSNVYSGAYYNSLTSSDPIFVNLVGGDFRLQTNSPCIDKGFGTAGPIDLDGRPRVVNGRIDIGAYEFQGASLEPFISWLYQYGLPNDGSADYADSDGDGMNNWQEWIAGTNPTNAASFLQMLSASNSISGTTKATWQSVSGKTYYLQRSTNLAVQPAFSSIQSNIVGLTNTTSFWDTTATNGNSFFYRVGVQ